MTHIIIAAIVSFISITLLAYEAYSSRNKFIVARNEHMEFVSATREIKQKNAELIVELEVMQDRIDDVSSLISMFRAQHEAEKSQWARDNQISKGEKL